MEKKTNEQRSWFWKWFLNNQVVSSLLIVLLILLIINAFTKVSYLFTPVWQFLGVVGLPIILSGILFYLMNPIVDYLEKKGVKRIFGILGLFVLVLGLIVWGIVVIVPKIQEQTLSFVDNFPSDVAAVDKMLNDVFSDPMFSQVQEQFAASGERIMNWLTDIIQNISRSTFQNIGNFFGAVASVTVAVVTMPVILFYLLKDGKNLGPFAVQILPTKMRKPTLRVLGEMNNQVSSYIRGQLTVAFAVAIMFMVGFSIIKLDYAITLGIVAGFFNLIPFLGSSLAMIPVVFLGIVGGPALLIKIAIVFTIEQTIEGRVISPLVLGNQLKVHPVTILVILLTAGQLFGLTGLVLGVPAYAAIKVVLENIFNWYKERSKLYEDENQPPVVTEVVEVDLIEPADFDEEK